MSIRLAYKAANGSNHPRYHLGAVIAKQDRVFAVASNEINRGCQYIQNKRWDNTLHAEAHAILRLLKAGRSSVLQGATLYVARVSISGGMLLAKPCKWCMSLAKEVGIKKVVYSNEQGETQCESLTK